MKKSKRQIKRDIAGLEITRLWGDVEVTDATHELRVFIRPEDLRGATRKDPAACVFARACLRTFGSTKVLFFRSVAYVELPNKDGTFRVERFIMTPEMRALVEAFDRGEETIPTAGFVLKPPCLSKSMNAQLGRQRAKDYHARLNGERVERHGNKKFAAYKDKPLALDMTVRSGSGSVHFSTNQKNAGDTKTSQKK